MQLSRTSRKTFLVSAVILVYSATLFAVARGTPQRKAMVLAEHGEHQQSISKRASRSGFSWLSRKATRLPRSALDEERNDLITLIGLGQRSRVQKRVIVPRHKWRSQVRQLTKVPLTPKKPVSSKPHREHRARHSIRRTRVWERAIVATRNKVEPSLTYRDQAATSAGDMSTGIDFAGTNLGITMGSLTPLARRADSGVRRGTVQNETTSERNTETTTATTNLTHKIKEEKGTPSRGHPLSSTLGNELTELATKHFIIRIFAKDSDSSFDQIAPKVTNRSLSENSAQGRQVLVDKPMLRNKTGLVLQEEGNLTREVKQALQDVFVEKLIEAFETKQPPNDFERKNVCAHLSYELPLPDEFVYSAISVGNKTVRISRNDTMSNSTGFSVPITNCSLAVGKGKTVNVSLPLPASAGIDVSSTPNLPGQAKNTTALCTSPTASAKDAPATFTASDDCTTATNQSTSGISNTTFSAASGGPNEGSKEKMDEQSAASMSSSTNFDDTGSQSALQGSTAAGAGMLEGKLSGDKAEGKQSTGDGEGAGLSEIEIVNLLPGETNSRGSRLVQKLCKLKKNRKACQAALDGGKVRLKGDKKRIVGMFVTFLESVAKQLKLDVLSVAEKLVEELEEKEKKKKAKKEAETAKREFTPLGETIPREYLPIMKTLTKDIEKDLSKAVFKMTTRRKESITER